MLEAFRAHIRKKDWGTAHQRLLVAVSGGLDSMVLLHLLQQAGCPMGVGHVNFQLRGAAADEDERFVCETCEQRKIPFHSTRVDTNNYAIRQRVSVQVAARELRYQWLVEEARRAGYTHIVTAHQANDNLETVLLNWIHGKGWDGWLGIPEQNELIIRPLLPFSREQVLTYAASQGITWREDESNLRDDYQRNAVRHHVVPELLKINPSLMDTFQRGLAKTQALPFLIKAGLAAAGQEGITVVGSEMRIGKRWLTGQPEPVSVLYEL
ncbi:MAG TPA: tRNA lysidine(34) synthetase TilS, partial [Cytophagales bacterium]|nr:tRNA lysidine(34) synthetase TilS [Cytophagales bacterium]